MPDSLTWGATLTGVTQNLVDTVAADQGYTVDDASGATSGWNVSVAAAQFATAATPAVTLPNTGTFSTNGSLTSSTATAAPTDACTSGAGTCTLPTNGVTYPVALPTDGTATVIYSAAALTGEGSIDIGGSGAADPVGWWLSVPGDVLPGVYTSTVTISLGSGP
jgi:hypothetical protein